MLVCCWVPKSGMSPRGPCAVPAGGSGRLGCEPTPSVPPGPGQGKGATREVLSLTLVPVWSENVICRHFTNSPVLGRKLASLISGVVAVCDWLGP